jgi:hypothetical protein
MIGFISDSTKLMLYTHTVGQYELEELATEFALSDNDTHFNQTIADRSGTYFENLSSSPQRAELPSATTGDMCYIQGSAGVLVRIDFPTLNGIYLLEDRVLLKAELVLRPALPAFENDLPEVLHFYETDRFNQQGDQLTYTYDSEEYNVEAQLVLDPLYNENSYYKIDITSYISAELAGNYYDTNNGLLATLPLTDFLSTAGHLILTGESANDYQPKLNLYFLTYE